MGEIVLRSGWDVFATAHNLEQNDYLVFKFCGNSSFKVQICSSHGGSQKITSFVNPHPGIFEAVPPSTTCGNIPNGKMNRSITYCNFMMIVLMLSMFRK